MRFALKGGLYTQGGSVGENNFFFANVYQLEVASGFGMGPCVHCPQHRDPSRLRPMQVLCVPPKSLWVYICITSAVSRRPVSLVSSVPMFSHSLSAFSSAVSWVPWRIWRRHSVFRIQCSKAPHSLPTVQLMLSVCSHLLREEACLIMAEQGRDLREWFMSRMSKNSYFLTAGL